MKKKQLKEYMQKPVAELKKEVQLLKTKLAKLKFDLASGKVKNIQDLNFTKKTIAQILTIINQKEKHDAK
ncbi:MAG: 50S ribosomal protein L29 [Minisyncoccia bacterium]